MATAKITRLHRNDYVRLCALELMKRDGLTELPGDGPFWAECCKMTEEIYESEGEGSEGNYLWPYCAKKSRIAADPTLTHAQKVPLIEALGVEYGKQSRKRQDKREAAKTPEQRAREKEKHGAIDAFERELAPYLEATIESAMASGGYPVYPLDVIEIAERPFFEHLTDAGRISVRGLGIRLD